MNESHWRIRTSLSVWAEARRVGESVRACRQWAIRRCGTTLSPDVARVCAKDHKARGPQGRVLRSLLPQPGGFVQSPDTEESLALTKRRM